MHQQFRSLSAVVVLMLTSMANAQPPTRQAHQAAQKLTAAQILAKAKAAIVTITAGDKTGTGFIVAGYLITCRHVIDGATIVFYMNSAGVGGELTSVSTLDPVHDIATFYVGPSKPSLTWGDYSALEVGGRVVVVGSPLGLEYTVTEGLASGKRSEGSNELLQLSAAVSPGSSGSPVFNYQGQVVGMVDASLQGGQQLNFAIAETVLNAHVTSGVSLVSIAAPGPTTLLKPSKAWPDTDSRAWLSRARELLVEYQQQLDTINPSGWQMKGLSTSDAAKINPIFKSYYDSQVYQLSETLTLLEQRKDEPASPGLWLRVENELRSLCQYVVTLDTYQTNPLLYQTDMSPGTDTALVALNNRVTENENPGPMPFILLILDSVPR